MIYLSVKDIVKLVNSNGDWKVYFMAERLNSFGSELDRHYKTCYYKSVLPDLTQYTHVVVSTGTIITVLEKDKVEGRFIAIASNYPPFMILSKEQMALQSLQCKTFIRLNNEQADEVFRLEARTLHYDNEIENHELIYLYTDNALSFIIVPYNSKRLSHMSYTADFCILFVTLQ